LHETEQFFSFAKVKTGILLLKHRSSFYARYQTNHYK
jgi:hypothetical protein